MPNRDYTFLGTTQSLCPDCLQVVPAKIIARGKRVYFRKRCEVHGEREDFICSDRGLYDQMDYALPAKLPHKFALEPREGCPRDCGLCTDHEQHTCIAIVELTSSCNLTCPMCYAASAPGGKHASLAECQAAIDRIVAAEGRPEVVQLSGGEPTIHPEFEAVLDYAVRQPIDYVMINTNGLRLASDHVLIERIARHKERVEIYFQMDGLTEEVNLSLRGEPLLERKLRALENLEAAGVHVTLVATLQAGVNEDQLGKLIQFGISRRSITGLSFQPATYSGRHVPLADLERRITFPDVIRGIAEQTSGMFAEADFFPLPCAHPNCHSLAIAWRNGERVTPLTRFIDAKRNLDLLANGISFTRKNARDLLLAYLGRQGCCAGDCSADNSPGSLTQLSASADASTDFFSAGIAGQLGAEDLFRITITSFLDAYNFDIRRLMKCCTHHVLPSGHIIPFCAYNTLYRGGHLPLPLLDEIALATSSRL